MIRILLMSDSHYEKDAMQKAREKYPDMDYYFHCGDSMVKVDSPRMEGFLAVFGNVDIDSGYPMERIIEIENHRIWMLHGHKFMKGDNPDYNLLARESKNRGCDLVFFGHTHAYYDNTIDGIRLLNPGSVWKTRDPSEICSLMIVEIEKGKLSIERVNYVTLLYG